MRATKVKSEQLERIIRLREASNASWLAIGKQIGIDRRTAQKAYEDWKKRQTQEELLGVRKEIAAEDFRDHRDCIITLASYLIDKLGLPDAPIETNSEQFFSALWQEDILRHLGNRWTSYPRLTLGHNMKRIEMKRIKSNIQENKQILECLQVHTKELRWGAFDEWKAARDKCIEVLGELRKESGELVHKFISEPRYSLIRLNEECKEKNAIEGMVEAVVQSIWLGIVRSRDKLEKGPLVQAVWVKNEQTALEVKGKTFWTFKDKSLAEKVAEVCNQAVINLCKGKEEEEAHIIHNLYAQVSKMKEVTEELGEMLSPLKLRPIILRTRCDLCPA